MFQWYFDIGIKTKLLAGFIWCAMMAAIVGLVGLYYINTGKLQDRELYQTGVVSLSAAKNISCNYKQIGLETQDILIQQSKSIDDKNSASIAQLIKEIEQDSTKLQQYAVKDKAFNLKLSSFKSAWQNYVQVENKILSTAFEHDINKTAKVLNDNAASISSVEIALTNMVDYIDGTTKDMSVRNGQIADNAKIIISIVFVIGFIWALLMGICIASVICKPINLLTEAADKLVMGDIDVHVEANTKEETGKLARAFSHMVENIKTNAEASRQLAAGNLDVNVHALSEKDIMAISLNEMIKTNRNLVDETTTLLNAAIAGQLHTRGNAERFSGSYRGIVTGFNNTLDEILRPITEAINCLKEMAAGNLAVMMKGDYKGDLAMIKQALNSTLDAFNDTLESIAGAVERVSIGTNQVSSSSHALSEGSTEASAAIEETSAAIHQIASQTNNNAENAIGASKLALEAMELAENGNYLMSQLLDSMTEINQSAVSISKIIKVIDEIAFQTNLLALNAAVEAARAGSHGKGFTVVAEEVRNLAQRSAKAAEEITEMIEESIRKTSNGSTMAEDTAEALGEIVMGANKVTHIINEIAASSKEQASGINEINQGITQVDIVTQQTTASSSDLAMAGDELADLVDQLEGYLARFKLR